VCENCDVAVKNVEPDSGRDVFLGGRGAQLGKRGELDAAFNIVVVVVVVVVCVVCVV